MGEVPQPLNERRDEQVKDQAESKSLKMDDSRPIEQQEQVAESASPLQQAVLDVYFRGLQLEQDNSFNDSEEFLDAVHAVTPESSKALSALSRFSPFYVDALDHLIEFREEFEILSHFVPFPSLYVEEYFTKLDQTKQTGLEYSSEPGGLYYWLYEEDPARRDYAVNPEQFRSDLHQWANKVREIIYDQIVERMPLDKTGMAEHKVDLIPTLVEAARSLSEIGRRETILLETIRERETESVSVWNTPTELLENDAIKEQLRVRQQLLALAFRSEAGITNPRNDEFFALKMGELVRSGEYDPQETPNAFDEQQITFAALVLAPQLSTQAFARNLTSLIEKPDVTLPAKGQWDPFISFDKVMRRAVAKQMSDGTNIWQGWKGKRAFEVGGTVAVRSLARLGALDAQSADAGHGGYGVGYAPGERNKMIELKNYREYIQPHTADVVCSSRLFDMGSGIGDIAEGGQASKSEVYGAAELSLVMANALKDGGFMIHYDGGLPTTIAEQIGVEKLGSVEGGAIVYRFDSSKRTADSFVLGSKEISFDKSTQTWERQVRQVLR